MLAVYLCFRCVRRGEVELQDGLVAWWDELRGDGRLSDGLQWSRFTYNRRVW